VKPHVFDYAERFTVEDRQVKHDEILSVWKDLVKPYSSELVRTGHPPLDHPEVSLLIALLLFEKHKLDWAAVETGIGGRYDPVSTLNVVATAITNVGKDHEDVLGSEHWQRALEKSGICRRGVPLVLGDDNPETVEVVKAECNDSGTPFLRVSRKEVKEVERSLANMENGELGGIFNGSRHQLQNAAVAMKLIRVLVKDANIDEVAPKLLETEYVGRFWRIEDGVYADVAHNPSKTDALAKEIEARFPRQRKVFIVGISGSRNPVDVVAPLVPQAKAVVVTAAGYKGQDPERVYSTLRETFPSLPIHLATKPRSTLKIAKNLRDKADIVVFTGSTYMIDQALNPDERLRHLNGAYGWREVRQQPSS
jgi:dihydrofolate synthase/folylpolyglutamate synthase